MTSAAPALPSTDATAPALPSAGTAPVAAPAPAGAASATDDTAAAATAAAADPAPADEATDIAPPADALDGAVPGPLPGQAEDEAGLPHDLSPWKMFLAADIVVKAVMCGLALASLVTWTIWLAKGLELGTARRRARRATRILAGAGDLDEAADQLGRGPRGPVTELAAAALREAERSSDLSGEGIKERVAIALSRIEARAGRNMGKGTGLLATIGSVGPFVGLFGTVWGIMNAFIGISQAHTTNLAVVAPGIAEALLATAIGLVAAIPAVIIYNAFSRAIAAYRALLSDASGEVLQHLSRDLERRDLARSGRRFQPMLHSAE